jgi:hypothetical protein
VPHFYEPDLGSEPDSPFARDGINKLVRRSYWLDMNDRSLVLVMTQGIGAHLTKLWKSFMFPNEYSHLATVIEDRRACTRHLPP